MSVVGLSVMFVLVLMSEFVAVKDVICSDVVVDSPSIAEVESNGNVLVAVVVESEKAVVVSSSVVASEVELAKLEVEVEGTQKINYLNSRFKTKLKVKIKGCK